MLNYLDNDDLNKVKLLYFLEDSAQSAIGFDEIQKRISFSKFQCIRLLEGLQEDLKEFHYEEYFTLDWHTCKSAVKYKRQTHKNISILIVEYAKRAKMQKLVHFLMSEKGKRVTDLESYLYLSHSGVYRILRKFKELSANYEIKISKKIKLLGNEWEIREFLYQFYYVLYKNFYYPFPPELLTDCQSIIQEFLKAKIFTTEVSDINYVKMLYRLSILQIRNHSGHLAENTSFMISETVYYSEEIYKIFKKYFPQNEQSLKKETAQFLFFLETEGIVTINQSEEQFPIQKLNIFFQEHIPFFSEKLSAFIQNDVFLKELSKIHRRLLFCKRTNFNVAHCQNFHLITEKFQIVQKLSKHIVQELRKKQKSLHLSKEIYEELTCEYFFLIINHLPESLLSETVIIYVDFSYGTAYNNYIIKNLCAFPYRNLKILESQKEAIVAGVDIYLSNIPAVADYPFQVLWSATPTAYDWESLGNTIIQARKIKNGEM